MERGEGGGARGGGARGGEAGGEGESSGGTAGKAAREAAGAGGAAAPKTRMGGGKVFTTGTGMKTNSSADFFVKHYRPCTDKSCRVSFRFEGCLDEVNLGARG